MSATERATTHTDPLSLLDNGELMSQAESILLSNNSGIFPRAIAAEILKRVAESGQSGNTEPGFTPFMIGVALSRIVSNYNSTDMHQSWRDELLEGLFFRKLV